MDCEAPPYIESTSSGLPPRNVSQEHLVEKMGMLRVAALPPQLGFPGPTPSPKSGRYSVHIVPEHTLSQIFVLVLEDVRCPPRNEEANFPPYGRRALDPWPTVQPLVLSQVSSQWRKVAHNTPAIWASLMIWHTNHSDTWRAYIARSKELLMDIEIYLPDHQSIELWDKDRIQHFKRIFKAIRCCSHRTRSLEICTPNTTIRIILNDVFERILFTNLEQLKVSQAGQQPQPLCFFGPMSFNPSVFRSLTLFGVMIDCYATCLEGVEEFHLFGSSGSLLDQEKLTHLTYPAIPPGPTVTHLRRLTLTGTYPIPDYQIGVESPISLIPSFNVSHLNFLHLSQYRNVESGSVTPALTCLFKMLCHAPILRHLELESFDEVAFNIFNAEMNQSPVRPQYPQVACIRLAFMPTSLITPDFFKAFPVLQQLELLHSPAATVSNILTGDLTLCPELEVLSVDGKCYPRDKVPVVF